MSAKPPRNTITPLPDGKFMCAVLHDGEDGTITSTFVGRESTKEGAVEWRKITKELQAIHPILAAPDEGTRQRFPAEVSFIEASYKLERK